MPFAVIGAGDVKLREGGCLADIAPTMLPYIGLPVPEEMTGKSIIASNKPFEKGLAKSFKSMTLKAAGFGLPLSLCPNPLRWDAESCIIGYYR